MPDLELSEVIALMLAAGGPRGQLVRVRWPLHKALRELHETAGRNGHRSVLGSGWRLRPSADHGVEVVGADAAIRRLVDVGLLRSEGQLRQATYRVDDEAVVGWRRRLMTLDAEHVQLLQRAGTRWAAMASTAAKNRSAPARSSASMVTSATPNRESWPVAEEA